MKRVADNIHIVISVFNTKVINRNYSRRDGNRAAISDNTKVANEITKTLTLSLIEKYVNAHPHSTRAENGAPGKEHAGGVGSAFITRRTGVHNPT